ncbi:unnamed protein product, partial [Didymodactylos carnosus]
RHVRTRLYFTSESHVHALLTIIRYGGLIDSSTDEQWKRSMDYLDTVSELNYLTQIVIMLFEDPSEELSSERRFHVELHFSPGAYGCFDSPPDLDISHSNLDGDSVRTILPKSNRQAAHSPPRQRDSIPEISVTPPKADDITLSNPMPLSISKSTSNLIEIKQQERSSSSSSTKVDQSLSTQPLSIDLQNTNQTKKHISNDIIKASAVGDTNLQR